MGGISYYYMEHRPTWGCLGYVYKSPSFHCLKYNLRDIKLYSVAVDNIISNYLFSTKPFLCILALQNKLSTLTPGLRYTHLALWRKMKLWKRLKVHKTSEIVRENAYDTVSRARGARQICYLSSRLRSFTRLKARERFRRLVLRTNPSRTRNNAICISSCISNTLIRSAAINLM